ncbi:MAG: hypothetical protein KC502_14340, partial [Myxococcales bacterium]|nr:hypothetical protein [Myxococcales bacterium]
GKASAKGKTSTKDRKAEALVHLRKAAEIDPHNPLVKRFLLAVLPKTTKAADKRALMREIIALSPNDYRLAHKLAVSAWQELAPHLKLATASAKSRRSRQPQRRPVAGSPAQPSGKASALTTTKPTAAVKTPAQTKLKPLLPAQKKALVADIGRAAEQLEETVPHTYRQALWEARAAVARGALKMSLPVYRLAAQRAKGKRLQGQAWCELAKVAGQAKAKAEQGEATRRCRATGG